MRINPALPKSISVTHTHLLACINTKIADDGIKKVAILDAGCGNGKLIVYLLKCLIELHPNIKFDFFGYDVLDHGVQNNSFTATTMTYLEAEIPGVDWNQHIKFISASDNWPFSNDMFDFVISNQVLEHVHDMAHFFKEHARVLNIGGVGFHLFPLKHYVYEGHLYLPWVHRFKSWDTTFRYIWFCSKLGLGKYLAHRREFGVSVDEFSTRHADYMFFWTQYKTDGEVLDCVRSAGLRSSYRFTAKFYFQKLRLMLRLTNHIKYQDTISFFTGIKLLRYVSGITLFVEKNNKY